MAVTRAQKIPQLTWDAVRPAPVVLVSGTESFLAERATGLLRDILRAEDASLEISDISADNYSPGEFATFASPSLFAEPRLVRVSGVGKCTDAFISDALSYLETPVSDCCIVLRYAGGVRGKKLVDALRGGLGNGIEIVCAELKKETDRTNFVTAEFRAANRKISPGAVRALVGAFSGDIAELAAACSQLLADTDDGVSEATVERYYAGRIETSAFRVADVAIAGRRGEALVLLRHAIASGADPVPIVAAFASKLRTIAKVSGARGSSAQLAQQFGLAPWQVDRAKRDLQGWTEEGLAYGVSLLAETDAQVKGAGRDPVFALERMVNVVSARGIAPH